MKRCVGSVNWCMCVCSPADTFLSYCSESLFWFVSKASCGYNAISHNGKTKIFLRNNLSACDCVVCRFLFSFVILETSAFSQCLRKICESLNDSHKYSARAVSEEGCVRSIWMFTSWNSIYCTLPCVPQSWKIVIFRFSCLHVWGIIPFRIYSVPFIQSVFLNFDLISFISSIIFHCFECCIVLENNLWMVFVLELLLYFVAHWNR